MRTQTADEYRLRSLIREKIRSVIEFSLIHYSKIKEGDMETINIHSTSKKLLQIAKPLAEQFACLDEVIFDAEDHITLEKLVDIHISDICSKLLEAEATQHDETWKKSACEALEKLRVAVDGVLKMINKHKDGGINYEYKIEVKKSLVTLLFSLCDVLAISDKIKDKNINVFFTKCLHCLHSLEEEVFGEEIFLGFKDFLNNFSSCISLLKSKLPVLTDKKQKNLVNLCVNQIRKCLPLLMLTIKTKRVIESDPAKCCKESERYVLQRISNCLTEIRNILETGSEPGIKSQLQHRELVETECGQFVHLVDEALNLLSFPVDKINESGNAPGETLDSPNHICPQLCKILSPKVEKILCHAMSVSHVAVAPKDAEAIISCGQRVLRELQALKDDCTMETVNTYEKNLHASSLSDALFCLEQKVNTALLRLVVEVFGNPCTSLCSLIIASTSASKDRETRCPEDLEDLIANYDLHMDRVVQIGVFAISCSNDKKRIPEIRSCLASLESLEPELVPTAVSLYLDSTSESKSSHLLFLAAHWRHEVAQLQHLLDGIVDPVAFSRVSYEEIHVLIINLKKVLFNSEEQSKAEALVGKIISRAQRMLCVCKQESSEFLNGQSILISDLEFSIAECKAGYKIAFYDTASKVSPETFNKNHQRVLQRCLLIASMIKKIEVQLSNLSGVLSSCSTRKSEASIGLDDSMPYRIGQSLISLNPRQQTITSENSCSTK